MSYMPPLDPHLFQANGNRKTHRRSEIDRATNFLVDHPTLLAAANLSAASYWELNRSEQQARYRDAKRLELEVGGIEQKGEWRKRCNTPLAQPPTTWTHKQTNCTSCAAACELPVPVGELPVRSVAIHPLHRKDRRGIIYSEPISEPPRISFVVPAVLAAKCGRSSGFSSIWRYCQHWADEQMHQTQRKMS
jgi:hypothetical protein